jgi:GNAT superfamily N-acetyltransferase
VDIGQLRSAESVRAGRLLAHAFAEDPVLTHFLYDPLRRRIAYPAFFRAVLEELLPCGHVYAAHDGDTLIGVAAWKPPDAPAPAPATQAAIERQLRLVRLLFPRTSAGLFQGFAALEHFHPAGPHWYLAFVGVQPAIQSRGIGRALLSPVLETADRTNAPCYLETPFPRTHAFYEGLGFTRQAEHRAFRGAPQGVVTFLREPLTRGTAR